MYKWPDKDKDETLDYSIDWSRLLGGETISGVSWFITDADGVKTPVGPAEVVNGLQVNTVSNTTEVATIRLALGLTNVKYKINCLITTNSGLAYDRSVSLRIKEK